MSRQPIAFDTETHLFGLGNMAPKVVCLTWRATDFPQLIVDDDAIEGWIARALDKAIAGDAVLVGCFTAYDFACIIRTWPALLPRVFRAYETGGVSCVAIRERLLNIASDEFHYHTDREGYRKPTDYHLADLVWRYLGRKLEKGEDTWRLRYGELDGVPLEQWPAPAKDYALGDSDTTFEVYRAQTARARQIGYQMPTEAAEVRADFALHLMSCWGVRTDREHVERMWSDTVGRMQEIAEEIATSGLCEYKRPEPRLFETSGRLEVPALKKKMKPMRAAIEEHWPGPGEVPRTPKGAIKTGAEVIAACKFEPLIKLARFEGHRKVANTYLSKFFNPVLHARYLAIGANSDRTSCREPNLQNQPRAVGVRESFVSRPGSVFLACDFDVQEMRTWAQSCLDICGRSKLAERFQADPRYDPHLEFAAALAGISFPEAQDLYANEDKRIKKLRQQAKISNFGKPGGLGDATFVDYAKNWGVDITLERSRQLGQSWKNQWPEHSPYFAHVSALVGSASYGRQVIPQSGFVRQGVGYTDACNGYFQTLAAHASKAALWAVVWRCYTACNGSYLYGSRPAFFIHDEIILETPEEAGHEAAQELEQVMAHEMMKWTPQVPATASATLMKRWSKSAQRVEQDGRLVAWEGGSDGQ